MLKMCSNCGMIRSTKDLVLLEDETYICFSCWNELMREKSKNHKEK